MTHGKQTGRKRAKEGEMGALIAKLPSNLLQLAQRTSAARYSNILSS